MCLLQICFMWERVKFRDTQLSISSQKQVFLTDYLAVDQHCVDGYICLFFCPLLINIYCFISQGHFLLEKHLFCCLFGFFNDVLCHFQQFFNYPFPSYDIFAADDFERILSKNRKSLIIERITNLSD